MSRNRRGVVMLMLALMMLLWEEYKISNLFEWLPGVNKNVNSRAHRAISWVLGSTPYNSFSKGAFFIERVYYTVHVTMREIAKSMFLVFKFQK
jgi:hypothetical protein